MSPRSSVCLSPVTARVPVPAMSRMCSGTLRFFLCVSIVALCFVTVGSAQVPTLHDRVANSGDINSDLKTDYPVPDFDTLVREASTIVIGSVRSASPVLTHEGSLLQTDYLIQVESLVRDDSGRVGARVTVRRPGGRTTLDGHSVVMSDPDFPMFEIGERYVLLLTDEPAEPFPMLRYGGQSAFVVGLDGNVRQASLQRGRWSQQRGGMSLATFMDEVRRVLQTR